MNESQWLVAKNPTSLLLLLRKTKHGTNHRLLRLYGLALWFAYRLRGFVGDYQRLTDDMNSDVCWIDKQVDDQRGPLQADKTWNLHIQNPFDFAMQAVDNYTKVGIRSGVWVTRATLDGSRQRLPPEDAVVFLRDIFSNPFRSTPDIQPAYRTKTVRELAETAYSVRRDQESGRVVSANLDGDRLAILADALEEAGCNHDAALTHLRSPGPHVCGCWALDLALGKTSD